MSKKNDRFVKEYSQGQFNVSEIWVDQYTGVNYLFHSSGNAGGFTPLLDCYGRIVVTPTKYNTIPFNDNSVINGQPFNGQFFNQCRAGDRRRVQWRYRKVPPLLFWEIWNADVLC